MSLLKKLFSKEKQLMIEFCEKNLDRFYSENDFSEFGPFLNSKGVQYKQYECQSKCKDCKKAPYALVNGEFIQADSPAELLEKVKEIK
ncbi:uncharacterized protein YuzB (UPF0349 family) [Cytobacillus horneckiae]|uniref:DUF1450 domain-containing protein n=1 Tax=Cytobacillus horneckiae TaxID=549687 RepID=A0A2N0ZHR5_9BACI|nr:DUF1450 domain-containing protein [Cytobacillus horneckiae]NRG48432.1 DUF1450 domain-containing protein [Bacillus sp. CRN 9]MBN6886958.1 DUF1450 domain-containing protein [Cytobacillus horneckiae]MCM3177572.1 YuzB family protein [Cytobacillus horneckiae]MEC1157875.1 DUF1450 domain-containing protein [Cytobacillus horneckiae]MED2937200.1 DUF1450 domain-containing protein [Cytobacillus horneckiae]